MRTAKIGPDLRLAREVLDFGPFHGSNVREFELERFSYHLENGFRKCFLFVLSASGWKEQNMDSSFSRQRKP